MLNIENRLRQPLSRGSSCRSLARRPGRVSRIDNPRTNLNRWYDPSVGRWLSEDPIGFDGDDANLYRYAGNAPTDGTDASGLLGTPFQLETALRQLDSDYYEVRRNALNSIEQQPVTPDFLDSLVSFLEKPKISFEQRYSVNKALNDFFRGFWSAGTFRGTGEAIWVASGGPALGNAGAIVSASQLLVQIAIA